MYKICFVITDALSFNVLCRGQFEYFKAARLGEMTFLCGGDKNQIDYLKRRRVGRVQQIPFVRKPNLPVDFFCFFYLLVFFIRNRFDLVVYSTPKALLLSSIATFIARIPNRVALVRGRVYENFIGVKKNVFKMLDKLAFALSTNILFISKSLMQAYRYDRVIGNQMGVVLGSGSSNGVDKKIFYPRSNYSFDMLHPFHVVSVGRICVDKGISELVAVIASVNRRCNSAQIKFTVVGQVEDLEAIEAVKALKHYNNVQIIPFTTKVADVFRSANLHLFLSRREGFGNVALEAAACGVPTFAFDVVGVRDSVSEESGKLFSFGDVDSIVESIIIAAKDSDAFKEKYTHTTRWAYHNYDSQLVWRNYLQYFRHVIDDQELFINYTAQ